MSDSSENEKELLWREELAPEKDMELGPAWACAILS
jgi:hypothetical protein